MYKILEVSDKIRVPPAKFGLGLEMAVKESLEEKWEGLIDRKLGVILSVLSIEEVGEGKILPENGGIHYPIRFKIIVYHPDMQEMVKGDVIDVTEFGVFVRIGPVDGMIHVSQIMDDFVSYDPKNAVFMGRESKRMIKEGDVVRAKIISVSMEDRQYKIGLTTRQPGLGVLSWIEDEKKKQKEREKKAAMKEAADAEKAAPKGEKK